MLSFGVLFIIGIGIIGGVAGGALFKKMKIPQVLGYIGAGILIGNSGFNIVSLEDVDALQTFNMFALGVIGFLVGSEIHFSTFKKYGKQLSLILFGEGLLAFFLTGIATGLAIYFATNSLPMALAGGIVLGSIASATDPASTISVLWEYRSAGIFTTTLIAIIALDDALAMGLYGIGTGVAQILSGGGDFSIVLHELMKVGYELGGSLVLGVVTGLSLTLIFRKITTYDNAVSAASGVLLFVVGAGIILKFDIILISMSAAVAFVNINPDRSKKFIEHVKNVSTPVYIFFFVLIGARISFNNMPLWVWEIIGLYVLSRSIGKFYGAKIGSILSKSEVVVTKYVGFGLFSQGGVAIGLSIMAAHHLDNIKINSTMSLGDLIISVVAMTTFIVQLIGPAAVKFAARKSDEAGKSITEKDLIDQYNLDKFVIQDNFPPAKENSTAKQIIEMFSQSDLDNIPIVDSEKKIVGVVGMDDIRSTFMESSMWQWLIAADIMNDKFHVLEDTIPLSKAFQECEQLQIDQIPVYDTNQVYVGYFDKRKTIKKIKSEIINNGSFNS